jgi:hypothetical protein
MALLWGFLKKIGEPTGSNRKPCAGDLVTYHLRGTRDISYNELLFISIIYISSC